ncbi:IDEAL domain-containing protein [Sutcliffiella sp. BMC8]|uniref:IDEAL domain-containing protein n=1 Tax=Sutcliffiella sp. BMC8 TaxID=3073243 RepID=UPI0030D4304E
MNASEAVFLKQKNFKKGDWVSISHISRDINPFALGSIGFVTVVHAEDESAKVLFLKHGSGKEIMRLECMNFENLSILPVSLEGEDLQALIDIALDSNDKEWFQELTERLQKELIGW